MFLKLHFLHSHLNFTWASFARKTRVCVCVRGEGGGGDNLDIKIFNANNCESRRRETTLGMGAGSGGSSELFWKMKASIRTCSEYLNIGREWEHVVRISPVKITVKCKYILKYVIFFNPKKCLCVCVGGLQIFCPPPPPTLPKVVLTCPFCPPPTDSHEISSL